jgi:hypothetical protein
MSSKDRNAEIAKASAAAAKNAAIARSALKAATAAAERLTKGGGK